MSDRAGKSERGRAESGQGLVRPPSSGRRWTSFIAADGRGRVPRGLHEEANPAHRLRVEHDDHTLLIHLSDEDGSAWTTVAVDRPTRRWAVAQGVRQADTARDAFQQLYEE
ncbi:MAG: hypothetical protein M3016_04290 [Actinomycetota bacterium]|nr:hypothetical protein [Actinomycetota bacterium]